MDAPTPDEVRARSALLTQRFPDGAVGDAALSGRIEVMVPVLSDLTGRSLAEDLGVPGVSVPAYLEPTAEQAVALKLERGSATAKDRKKAINTLNLRSFSAGPYSESYFGPGEAAEIKKLDPDPEIAELLWALATEDKRAYWLAIWGETVVPGAAVQSFDWRARRRVP